MNDITRGISPIFLDDVLRVRDATPQNDRTRQMVAAIADDIGDADALVLHYREHDPAVLLPFRTWKRLLLSVAAASGEDPAKWASR